MSFWKKLFGSKESPKAGMARGELSHENYPQTQGDVFWFVKEHKWAQTPETVKSQAQQLAASPAIGVRRLCEELQHGWPMDRGAYARTKYRRVLLAALELIGDPKAAAVVAEVANQDGTILPEATQVLQAIKHRHPTAALPPALEPPSRQPKSVSPTGSAFVERRSRTKKSAATCAGRTNRRSSKHTAACLKADE